MPSPVDKLRWRLADSVASLPAKSIPKSTCLILHAGALGDCALTLHIAMAMQRAGHKITLAARSPIAAWAARRGMIDEAIPLERLSLLLWGAGPHSDGRGSDAWSLVKDFDHIFSFLGGPDESLGKRLTGLFGPGRVIHIDSRPSEATLREGIHITRQWSDEIRTRGHHLQFEISDLRLPIGTDNELPIETTFPHHDMNALPRHGATLSPRHHITMLQNVVVHPGSGGRAKCCPLEALEAFVRELLARGWNARWMIGPDEMERDGAEFRRRLERTAPVIFEESVVAAANLVAEADVFVGNDAGMTHVAALAGVNAVALFGPTDPRVWRPPGSNVAVFRFPSPDEPEENWVGSLIQMIAGNQ
jgi:hypothetical protein